MAICYSSSSDQASLGHHRRVRRPTELPERGVLCYVSHFLVGDGDVHEEFFDNEIQVSHCVDFWNEISDVLEEFMKLLVCGKCALCVVFLCFEFLSIKLDHSS